MAQPRRVPVFVPQQLTCESCGREITDALTVEELGRYCSPRCYHARGLPVLRRQGA